MRSTSVPTLDTRYWIAMLVASVLGTTAGDFVSNDLGLGFAGALPPLVIVFAAVMVAERRAATTGEAYYWVAVVVARMAATNLGDLVARTLHLGYGWVSVTDGVLLVTVLVATRRPAPGDRTKRLVPATDARYWAALLLASVMGTNGGDFLSTDTALGLGGASLLLAAVTAPAIAVELRSAAFNLARYWSLIALIRTTGTVMGDFLSGGLHLGFAAGATCGATLLVAVLTLPRWRALTAVRTAARVTRSS